MHPSSLQSIVDAEWNIISTNDWTPLTPSIQHKHTPHTHAHTPQSIVDAEWNIIYDKLAKCVDSGAQVRPAGDGVAL